MIASSAPRLSSSWLLVLLAVSMVVPTLHAVTKHGPEAQVIRECLERNGPAQVWQDTYDPNKFFQCVLLPDGRWGLQVVRWRESVKHWVERTAFIKGDGSLVDLTRYLMQFARTVNP